MATLYKVRPKITRARRITVSEDKLSQLYKMTEYGVTFKRAIEDLDLSSDVSVPKLRHLLDVYTKMVTTPSSTIASILHASLFPPYHTPDADIFYMPDGWCYCGIYPLGEWMLYDDAMSLPVNTNADSVPPEDN